MFFYILLNKMSNWLQLVIEGQINGIQRLLLEGQDVNHENHYGQTALSRNE